MRCLPSRRKTATSEMVNTMQETDPLQEVRKQWEFFEEGDSTEFKLENVTLDNRALQFLLQQIQCAGTGKFWVTEERPFRIVLSDVVVPEGTEDLLKDLFEVLDELYRLTFLCPSPPSTTTLQDSVHRVLTVLLESDLELSGIHVKGIALSPEIGELLGLMACRLEKLAFSRCTFTTFSMETFAKATSGSLKKFWFHRCSLNDTLLSMFVDHCNFEPNCLQELDLSLNQFSEQSFDSLGRLMQKHRTSLKRIYLGGNRLFSDPIRGPSQNVFLEALQSMQVLRTVHFRKCRIRHGAVELLRSLPDSCQKLLLRETWLFAGDDCDEIMAELGPVLQKETLQELDLSNCCLSNPTATQLFGMLEQNTSIRALELKHNRFQMYGWHESLPRCTHLTGLSLPSSICTETTWPLLETALRRNPSLTNIQCKGHWEAAVRQVAARNTCWGRARTQLGSLANTATLWPWALERLSIDQRDAGATFWFLHAVVGPLVSGHANDTVHVLPAQLEQANA